MLVKASLLLLLLAASAQSQDYPDPGYVTGDTSVHDPSMIRVADGTYYLYYTGGGINILTSTDRITFTSAGEVLPDGATWATAYSGWDDIWAPDVSYHGGVYLIYYAVSTFGSQVSAIGLARSTTGLPGSWTDEGLVFASDTSDDYNAIDPCLFVDDDGNWWLSFGSFWTGIKMISIDSSTGKQSTSDTTVYSIAERLTTTAIEASYVYPYGDYYYLFVSFDICCEGVNSTYNIRVGRSTSPTGPYVDESGTEMMSGGGTLILGTHDYVIGPGGQSVMTDVDGTLIVYHYYDGDLDGTPELGINLLSWSDDGWPTVS